jgi:restriction system protein
MTERDRIPNYEAFMLPTLRVLADGGELSTREAANTAADLLAVPAEARTVTISSGTLKYVSKAQWAQTYLAQAGLIARPRRGVVAITAEGKVLLEDPPAAVNKKYLERFPSFVEFQNRTRRTATDGAPAQGVAPSDESPEELVSEAVAVNVAEVESDLLARIRRLAPAAFERLVLRVLVALGYGTTQTATQTGRSGDEGIDGIIHRDALGLDRVYMQAKRYTDNAVGPEAINAFYGALQRKGADRGVFITSSTFTAGAKQAERDFRNVVLIDGDELVRLMVAHGIGVEVTSTHVLRRLDEDYFGEL